MARGLREIKRQIKSIQGTKQITKAMEMVAASKLRRAQEMAQHARPYSDKLKEVVSSIASGTKGIKHPMFEKRPVKKTGYLVITSDRGLCGGYNSNILKAVMSTIKEKHKSKDEYVIFVIGRKGRDYFRRREMLRLSRRLRICPIRLPSRISNPSLMQRYVSLKSPKSTNCLSATTVS